MTELRRCAACELLFRAPGTPAEESTDYYQEAYDSGLTTSLPGNDELAAMVASNFADTSKSFDRYVAILTSLGARRGMRLLDFGCSWGYGTWQLRKAGFDAVGYEVSRPRARYAVEKLSLAVVSALPADWAKSFDIVFSAHVIEHVPNVADTFRETFAQLRPGNGLYVAITPNGSLARRAVDPRRWQNVWGLKHPNMLDERFWTGLVADKPTLLTTDLADLAGMREWREAPRPTVGPLTGDELLFACTA